MPSAATYRDTSLIGHRRILNERWSAYLRGVAYIGDYEVPALSLGRGQRGGGVAHTPGGAPCDGAERKNAGLKPLSGFAASFAWNVCGIPIRSSTWGTASIVASGTTGRSLGQSIPYRTQAVCIPVA